MTDTAMPSYGASPEEWATFDLLLGLTEDLLPVVSNPNAVISPDSKMKALGKTPSRYNRLRQVAGFSNWTTYKATSADVARWSGEDYGICLQTRTIRALDVDIDDPDMSAKVRERIEAVLPGVCARTRPNSSKFLVPVEIRGEYAKRIIKTAQGAIEFLAGGQQFVAAGTHPSGARYTWVPYLPVSLPLLAPEAFEALWSSLVAEFGIEEVRTQANNRKGILAQAVSGDPVALALIERDMVLSHEPDGRMHIVCPFAEEHSDDGSESATTYFPAHTGGYEHGNFKCLHAHCADRSNADYLRALGMEENPADDFEALGDAPSGNVAPSSWPEAVDLEALDSIDALPPRFIIPDWLPEGTATLFAGHGGAGKSGMALHLSSCISLGEPFFGLQPVQRRVLYLSCEDRAEMLHWRLSHICDFMKITLKDLKDHLYLLDLVGKDSLLYNKDPRTGKYITPAFRSLKERISDYKAEVLVVDGIADTFAGNENSRGDVKQFVNMLIDVVPLNGALILVGHVAKPATILGSKSSEGYSGSTGWHNSVRARWYLYPEQTEDESAKANRLILALQKSNYGLTDQSIAFEWHTPSHLFVGTQQQPSTPQEKACLNEREQHQVLATIVACQKAGVKVPGAMQGHTTAVGFLRVHPEWPVSLRADRRETRARAKDHLTALLQHGLIRQGRSWSENRNSMQVLEATEEGVSLVEGSDLVVGGDEK